MKSLQHCPLLLAIALAALAATPCISAADPTWRLYGVPRQVAPISIYDPDHRRMLMIGTGDATDAGYVIWSCDLDTHGPWAPILTSGEVPVFPLDHSPVPLAGGIADRQRNRVIVWGGSNTYLVHGTWALALDTFAWTKISDDGGPDAYGGAGVVYDPILDRVLLMGGLHYTTGGTPVFLSAVYELNLSGTPAWSQLAVSGPQPVGRAYAAVIFDNRRDRVLMYGGRYHPSNGFYTDLAPLDETWELSLSGTPAWRFLPPSGTIPQARYSAFAGWDSVADRMIVYGGIDSDQQYLHTDLWSLTLADPDSARWTHLPDPGAPNRRTDLSIFDSERLTLVVAGGDSVISAAGIQPRMIRAGGRFELDVTGSPSWSTAWPDADLPGSAGPAVQGVGNRIVTMAMLNDLGVAHNPVFWTAPVLQPPGWIRFGPFNDVGSSASMIFDPVRNRVLIYANGGAEIWSFSFADLTSSLLTTTGTPPPTRDGGQITLYDPTGDRMLVYGGVNYGGGRAVYLSDLWALNLTDLMWQRLDSTVPRPPARADPAAVVDAAQNRLVIYGGVDTLGMRSDVWSFSLDSLGWHPWFPTGTAPPSYSPCAAIDGNRHRMLVVKDKSYPAFGEAVFALSLTGEPVWTQLPIQGFGPGPREFGTFTSYYDDALDRLVVYLKAPLKYSDDTWPSSIWTLYPQDWTTPVEVAVVDARVENATVHLAWSVTPGTGAAFTVERRMELGTWQSLGPAVPDSKGRLAWIDPDVVPGSRYDYRLRIEEGSAIRYAGEVTIEVPGGTIVFRAMSNPVTTGLRFRVALPPGVSSGARIELYDPAGRRALRQELTLAAPQPFDVVLDGAGTLRPGVYQARLVGAGRMLARTRVAIIR